jgi:bifunctional ADP-heptose synthase (sugar kinase/adenylyltransferase)
VTVLAALRPVDAVVVFHELTAEALVSVLRPDIYVKGGDWAAGERRPPEAAAVESYGGQVVFLPYLAGHSTSEAIAHIQRLPVDADDRRE